MQKILNVVQFNCIVRGRRNIKDELRAMYGIEVSEKKIARLKNEMNLKPAMPKKDAYKGQATHDHECSVVFNYLNRNFYLGPRRAILTDITYIFYGLNRDVCYLCAFRDACTTEILGYAISKKMDVELIKAAYDKMNEHHGSEFNKDAGVFIHHDCGSQYLSTEFKRILSDDKFIQSCSRRGNSQDNAPMESFFARFKTATMDLIASENNYETVCELISGYIKHHNTEMHSYNLAGLTPHQFYLYLVSGIYPLEEYWGVKVNIEDNIKNLLEARAKKAKEKRVKPQNNTKLSGRRSAVEPYDMALRDFDIVNNQLKKWEKKKEIAVKNVTKFEDLQVKVVCALNFMSDIIGTDTYNELRNPYNWRKHPALDYVDDMVGLF